MPYDPQISYQAPQLTLAGFQGLGSGIAQAAADWRKRHDELAKSLGEADAIMQFGDKSGLISPQQKLDYMGMSASQKANQAEGLAKTIVLAQQAQEADLNRKNAIKVAQIAHAAAGAAAAGMTPEQLAAAQQQAWAAGKAFIQTSRGGGVVTDYAGGGTTGIPADKVGIKKLDTPEGVPAQWVYYNKDTNETIKPTEVGHDPSLPWYLNPNVTMPGAGGMPGQPGGAPTFNLNPGATPAAPPPIQQAQPNAPAAGGGQQPLGANEKLGYTSSGQPAVFDVSNPNNPVFKRYAQ